MPSIGPVELFLVVIPWLLMLAGYLVFLVAAWRLMKAHEAIAAVLKEIAGNLKGRRDDDFC
jgi:hypothetical protein